MWTDQTPRVSPGWALRARTPCVLGSVGVQQPVSALLADLLPPDVCCPLLTEAQPACVPHTGNVGP